MITTQQGKLYKTMILAALVSLVLFFSFQTTVYSSDIPEVRVAISLQQNFLELSFDSGYNLVNAEEDVPLALPGGKYKLSNANGLIEILDGQGHCLGLYSDPLYLEPFSEETSGSSFFSIDNACYGQKYRGMLEIFLDGGTLRAINILDPESYLKGVLPREMPPSWGDYGGMEALKAQAVAARTYALDNMNRQRHDNFHLCDTQHCQVYAGIGCETENTNRALDETRGEILTFNSNIIELFYHATNGGYTELPQNVWTSSLPCYAAVPDPFDDPSNPLGLSNFTEHSYARWETEVPLNALGFLLADGRTGENAVERVYVASVFPSGRVQELVIRGTEGQTVSLFKEKARTALGLKSQLYTVDDEPKSSVWIVSRLYGAEKKEHFSGLKGKCARDGYNTLRTLDEGSYVVQGKEAKGSVPYLSLTIKGLGWGHGIGMSQNGAYNRSKAGQVYEEILSFYYPGTEMEKIY